MELLTAIYTLEQIYPNGVMLIHLNCYLGLDQTTVVTHIKELRRLLRKGGISLKWKLNENQSIKSDI